MNEMLGDRWGSDPDDLAIALGSLLRMRGYDVKIRLMKRDACTMAIEVMLGERVIAIFPCFPVQAPDSLVDAMNQIVGSVPMGGPA